MSEYGITSIGFVKKSFISILNDKIEKARLYFGKSIDLRPTSTLYKWLQLQALEEANLWELAEQYWNSMYITTANGVPLELLGEDRGLYKQEPQFAIGIVTFTGTNYVLIPIGVIVSTYNLDAGVVRFKTTESRYVGQVDDEQITFASQGAGPVYTLVHIPAEPLIEVLWWDDSANGGDGGFITLVEGSAPLSEGEYEVDWGTDEITINTVGGAGLATDDFLRISYVDSDLTVTNVSVVCMEFGAKGNVPTESIISLETPVSGVTSVLNENVTDGGRDIETDNSFRRRLLEQPRTIFSVEHIKSAVENADGVKSAFILEGVRRDVFQGADPGITLVTLERTPQDPLREVEWWDASASEWYEMEEATAPLGPYQFEANYSTGEVTLGSNLMDDDVLNVLYVDNDIGAGIFLVLVDPLVSPLTAEVENVIAGILDQVRPAGIAYQIEEIVKIGILVDVDITIELGYSLDDVREQIDKFLRYYIDGPSSTSEAEETEYVGIGVGGLIVRNELVMIVMQQDGVNELSDLVIQIEDEPIDHNVVSGNDVEIATIDDVYPYGSNGEIYGGIGKTGSVYVEGTDWTIVGNHITWISTPAESTVYINYRSVIGNAQIGDTQAPDYRGGSIT